jgi:hypothetical protein
MDKINRLYPFEALDELIIVETRYFASIPKVKTCISPDKSLGLLITLGFSLGTPAIGWLCETSFGRNLRLKSENINNPRL